MDVAAIRDPHARARDLAAARLSETLAQADETWLEAHLLACDACRTVEAAYRAHQARLRTLRDREPQAPRDLWARTSIALEREGGRSLRVRRASHPDRVPSRPARGWPAASLRRPPISMRVASGLLVVALAATSLVVNGIRQPALPGEDSPLTSSPAATPITVAADIGWLQPAADGSYDVFITHVEQVCPEADPSICEPITETARGSISLGSLPESVSYSAAAGQLVVVSSGAAAGGSVIVVPVPTAPVATPSPDASPGPDLTPSPSVPVVAVPSGSPAPSGSVLVPTLAPPTPEGTPQPSGTQGSTDGGAIAIAHDVIVVGGSAAYSSDGTWLAFAARPADGSAGPDVYVWKVGDPVARMITQDHRSVFSAWLGSRLLGTRMEAPADLPVPDASAEPEVVPDGTPLPGRVPSGTPGDEASPSRAGGSQGGAHGSPAASASGTPDAEGTPEPVPSPAVAATGVAFLLDPATGGIVDLESLHYVRPVVDPTGQWVVYWEGSLDPVANGLEWRPGSGRIVVAPWTLGDGSALFPMDPNPAASPEPAAPTSWAPATAAATATPERSLDTGPVPGSTPEPTSGPAAYPIVIQALIDGPLDDFDARFDPTGTHLAIWASHGRSAVGSLSLFVLADGRWTPGTDDGPAGRPALRGFSIGEGELAWVAPDGPDGSARRVRVLGWTADGIGSVVSTPARSLIVIR